MQERSSRVLTYIADLCGLPSWAEGKLRAITWVLADRHSVSMDDVVQEMALTAWVGQLTGVRPDLGTLIAAANRVAAGQRRQ